MTARTPQLRKKTAREIGEKLGLSARTIRRYVAAPRNWWEDHRREIRAKAARLRATGMKWSEIGKVLGCSTEAARALGSRGMGKKGAAVVDKRDPNTIDMFDPR